MGVPIALKKTDLVILAWVTSIDLALRLSTQTQHSTREKTAMLDRETLKATGWAAKRWLHKNIEPEPELESMRKGFKALLNQSSHLMWLLSLKGTVLEVSHAALALGELEGGVRRWVSRWRKDRRGGLWAMGSSRYLTLISHKVEYALLFTFTLAAVPIAFLWSL